MSYYYKVYVVKETKLLLPITIGFEDVLKNSFFTSYIEISLAKMEWTFLEK